MKLQVLNKIVDILEKEDFHDGIYPLRTAFLKNKQSLEKETCMLANIIHDDTKVIGEDGYLPTGEKVEIKNSCYFGNTKISGSVKFHDLNPNRIDEFIEEDYWLVIGCWNAFNPELCEMVYGFNMDHRIGEYLHNKVKECEDPTMSLVQYDFMFYEKKVKLFYTSSAIYPNAYTQKLLNNLDVKVL